uniref:NADP-dependent oxidoreductase domain-containing protein n=1 Tax=Sus scrofa TaxID=9823 RepID=A0A8D0VKC6_PIG
MQVNIEAEKHRLKKKNIEARVLSKKISSQAPNMLSGTRVKFKYKAVVMRSLAHFTHLHNLSIKSNVAKNSSKEVRKLGKGDIRIACVCITMWVSWGKDLGKEFHDRMITLSYESGKNLKCTGELFEPKSATCLLGAIKKKRGWPRSSARITSQLYWKTKSETMRGLKRKHLPEPLKFSLQRLNLEYRDVKFASKPDWSTPMEEIVKEMTGAHSQGLVTYWDTKTWTAEEIIQPTNIAKKFNNLPPVTQKAPSHLFLQYRIKKELPAIKHKVGV